MLFYNYFGKKKRMLYNRIQLNTANLNDIEKESLCNFLSTNNNLNNFDVFKNIGKYLEWLLYVSCKPNANPKVMFDIAKQYETEEKKDMALKWYKNYVDKTMDARCMYKIGIFYEKGFGVIKDKNAAYETFLKSADIGYPNACFKVASYLYDGKVIDRDYEKAFHYFKESEKNYMQLKPDFKKDLFYKIGLYYFYGYIFEKDIERAYGYFLKASELGNTQSCSRIGFIFEKGIHFEKNTELAKYWYEKAILQDDAYAKSSLALYYLNCLENNYERAVVLMTESHLQGNKMATYHLGKLYLKGLQYDSGLVIVEKNISKAIEYFTYYPVNFWCCYSTLGEIYRNGQDIRRDVNKAFEYIKEGVEKTGHGNMYCILGKCYLDGFGTTKDVEKAKDCFEKAIEKDNTSALVCMGDMYLNGEYFQVDYDKAYEFYEKSCAEGISKSFVRIGQMYENGYKFEKDYVKAIEYYDKAIEIGSNYAKFHKGLMYENGIYFEKNIEKAFELFKEAADKDLKDALFKLGTYYEEGILVEKNIDEANKLYILSALRSYRPAIDLLSARNIEYYKKIDVLFCYF